MDNEEKHYPDGTEIAPTPVVQEPPAPAPEEPKTPEGDEAPKETPAAITPAESKDEEEGKGTPEPVIKKRSTYEDLKIKRQEAAQMRDVAHAAIQALGITLTGTETYEDLQALLTAQKTAKTPEEKKEAADDIKTWAEKRGIEDPSVVEELVDLVSKRVKPVETPSVLTEEEAAEWRKTLAANKAAEEDRQVKADAAPVIKDMLPTIHNDEEKQAIETEIVRLAHTKEFANMPVDYIVFKNKDALAKMISPKKPSFEAGGHVPMEGAPTTADYSTGKGVTPDMLTKELERPGRSTSALEIRHAR